MVPVARMWERYGKIALGVLAALVVGGVVAFMALRSRAASEETAAGKLAEASLFYWQGDYQRSLALAKETAEQYGSTPSGRDAHRQAADAAYWGGDFKTAVAEYRRYLASNPSGLLGDAARRSLAYALESDRQFLEAVKEYDALVGKFDRSSSAEFLTASTRCLIAARQVPAAIEHLQRLVNEFGETEYANQGRVELAELQAYQAGTAQR
ncbi:MAG TPA: tetratricopeptide repeat protein [Candidatus Eisenbacteria bacterium]|nr:tetratricopeptide repeat protein [Candidatus Eisenbacteria bacterium]